MQVTAGDLWLHMYLLESYRISHAHMCVYVFAFTKYENEVNLQTVEIS